ncbi:N-acetyltransferase [Arachnia propionica]|uniref:N-acetyltransferase n=1 Tax=Arachnia propionica TaxID=1750 RepID=A0A3P1T1L1_9ACTN|nr:N-acetyltransferase [Arachnia propionica]
MERFEQPTGSEEPSVTHDEEARRYEVRLGDELAGFVDYILSEGRITFTHTEIDPAFEGRGLGSALIRGALDDVAANPEGRRVQPLCPFVKGWMQRHPEYLELARR